MKEIPKVKQRIACLLDQRIQEAKELLRPDLYVSAMADTKSYLMSANLTNDRKPKFDKAEALAVGQEVKKRRLEVRFTQEYVASEIGLSQADYSRCENGQKEFTPFQLGTFEKLIINFKNSKKCQLTQ
jgi:DNA-binding XRE family transcriptional regulator